MLNMTTQQIIETLRELAVMGVSPVKEMRAAADRLEELQFSLDEIRIIADRLTHERNKARAEVDYTKHQLEAEKETNTKFSQDRDSLRMHLNEMIKIADSMHIERDEARAKVQQLRCEIDTNDPYMWRKHWAEAIQQRDEARAEVERLKQEQAFEKGLIPSFAYANGLLPSVEQSLTVRPEPSRLEIAAHLMAHSWPHDGVFSIICSKALEQADALIAVAREGK